MNFEYCEGKVHVVKEGDSLYKISKMHQVPLAMIMRANPYVDVYNLQIGTEICVPVPMDRPEHPDAPAPPDIMEPPVFPGCQGRIGNQNRNWIGNSNWIGARGNNGTQNWNAPPAGNKAVNWNASPVQNEAANWNAPPAGNEAANWNASPAEKEAVNRNAAPTGNGNANWNGRPDGSQDMDDVMNGNANWNASPDGTGDQDTANRADAPSAMPVTPNDVSSSIISYVVKDGDTLQDILRKYDVDLDDLLNFNKSNKIWLKPGTKLVIPEDFDDD